ncbi:MAG: carbamate kinase [Actinomycetes bacterium]
MRIVVALGGNAMSAPDGSTRPQDQIAAVRQASREVVRLLAAGHRVTLTHGNGPQVGNILVKNELAASVVPPVPLDWCVAQTEGTIGFILLDALDDELRVAGLPHRSAALVTRTLVDADDPAFGRPTKPVGRHLPEHEARLMMNHGQVWQHRGHKGWRRVVASPEPRSVLDAPTVASLLDDGYVVIASGGGGIPVVRNDDGSLRGIEAVIDKDLTAVLLAREVRADVLIVATDVDNAVAGWGTDDERPIGRTTPAELRSLADEGHFASGSMGPKVEAVCRFVESGGSLAVITSLTRIHEAATGTVGTAVRPS